MPIPNVYEQRPHELWVLGDPVDLAEQQQAALVERAPSGCRRLRLDLDVERGGFGVPDGLLERLEGRDRGHGISSAHAPGQTEPQSGRSGKSAAPSASQLDRQHLVQLDLRCARSRAGNRPCRGPRPARWPRRPRRRRRPSCCPGSRTRRRRVQRVVLAQVLLVPHLEAAGVLHRADDPAGPGQLAVGEDVAVDEAARQSAGAAVVRAGDAVVEQPAAGAQLVAQEARSRPGSWRPRCARSGRSS